MSSLEEHDREQAIITASAKASAIGMVCPNCGNKSEFMIAATIWGMITENGFDQDRKELPDHNSDYDEYAGCICPECQKSGIVQEFQEGPDFEDDDPDKCDKCGGAAPDGGDGYDGLCADCADKALNASRELGAILAALRFWQRSGLGGKNTDIVNGIPFHQDSIATGGGEFDALDADEIDELCERMNQ